MVRRSSEKEPFVQDERSNYDGGLVSHLDANSSTAACRIAMENPPMKKATQQTLVVFAAALLLAMSMANIYAEDSLPPLNGRPAPTNLTEMWQGFDPLRDPLDTEVVREWKEGDATYRYVVFTIGTFKGQKSRVAAFYGFPKSDKKLPALMHLHGGGQRAFIKDVKDAVKYGYVGLSVNWGGREMEDAKPGDKNTEYTKTLDPVGSPRNIGWFMYTLIARRGLTFLQQQPEVDPNRLGVYGHSMGGKITTDLAGIDQRVTVAVPSCGNSTSITMGGKIWNIPNSFWKRKNPGNIEAKTIDTQAYLPTLTCPILDLTPSNDHNGPIDLVTEDWEKIGSKQVYHSTAPHLGHLHLPETQVTQWLWFEQWLNKSFEMPKNPEIRMDFKSSDGVPRAIVKPDATRKIKAVDIYYSTETHVITRFWRDGEARAMGGAYVGACPVMSLENPFYAFANITYELEEPFKTKYGIDRYIITSKELIILPDELAKAGVKATDHPTKLVEDFSRGWHDWYGSWDKYGGSMTTYKIKDPKWRGSAGENLCLELKSARDTKVELIFTYNKWWAFDPNAKTGKYSVTKELKGSRNWQTISVGVDELQPQTDGLPAPITNNWQYIADVTVKARVDEIRKIYWAKGSETPAPAPVKPATPSHVNRQPKAKSDDLPELAGKSEEFKEAVRQSLEAGK